MYIHFFRKHFVQKFFTLLGNVRFFFESYFKTMFPYTVKYTEAEYDIQNINLLYNTHQTCQNTFTKNTKSRENQNPYFSKKSISK